MELITPKFEIWEQSNTLEDMWKHIARCTRVCYQSTPKKDGETDEEFVKRVILHFSTGDVEPDINKVHGAMLEHGNVYLVIPDDDSFLSYVDVYRYNPYTVVNYDGHFYYISTNLRVLFELDRLDDLKYYSEFNPCYHSKRVTVCFTTNIGVSREFNRHRVNSIAEESTRYCNYTKDRFGASVNYSLSKWLLTVPNKDYIKHHQFDPLSAYIEDIMDNTDDELYDKWCSVDYYMAALKFCEWAYVNLINKGWTPQMARMVLPLATKSQLVHTAFISAWEHFFALRADGVSGAPHPDATLLAKPLKEEFIKRGYL